MWAGIGDTPTDFKVNVNAVENGRNKTNPGLFRKRLEVTTLLI